MAHKKGQGSSKNGRDSNPQFRGIKLYGGPLLFPLHILQIVAREDVAGILDLQKLSEQLSLAVLPGNPHVDEV